LASHVQHQIYGLFSRGFWVSVNLAPPGFAAPLLPLSYFFWKTGLLPGADSGCHLHETAQVKIPAAFSRPKSRITAGTPGTENGTQMVLAVGSGLESKRAANVGA
jgi:hypothetical protein